MSGRLLDLLFFCSKVKIRKKLKILSFPGKQLTIFYGFSFFPFLLYGLTWKVLIQMHAENEEIPTNSCGDDLSFLSSF